LSSPIHGVSSGFLAGRPFPGALRLASKAALSYKGDWVIGFIPALDSLVLTVLLGDSEHFRNLGNGKTFHIMDYRHKKNWTCSITRLVIEQVLAKCSAFCFF
jgi:hypothetical protein